MKLLQLLRISDNAVASVTDSFDRLPYTDHKDGKYRLRRYSAVEVRTTFWNAKEEAEIRSLDRVEFTQGKEWNNHQGGMTRTFESIEEEVLQSEGFKEICLAFKKYFNIVDGQEVEVHQMRVRTLEGEEWTQVSPEGVHQDGYDHIAIIGINRHNIEGGELLAYLRKDEDYFLKYDLDAGEVLMLDDSKLWHNASPIRRSTAAVGYGDWFVLTAHNDKGAENDSA